MSMTDTHAMAVSAEASCKIRNMSLLCAILIVSIHVGWPYDVPLSLGWLIDEGVKKGIANIAVPYFFIISGFFIARHFNEPGWYQREIKKRLKSLLVPYFAWSFIALLAAIPAQILADISAHRVLGTSLFEFLGESFLLRMFGFDFSAYPFYFPLWYLRCLFLLVLASPLIDYFVSRHCRLWFAAAVIFMLSIGEFPLANWHKSLMHLSCGVLYFSIGVAVQRAKHLALPSFITCCSLLLGTALLITKMILSYKGMKYAGLFETMSVPFLIYFTWQIVPCKKWPVWLTWCSFPLFLMHAIAIGYTKSIFRHICSDPLLLAIVVFVVSVVGSCMVALLMRKYMPKLSSLVFGGRM